jgi:hypothetical protein
MAGVCPRASKYLLSGRIRGLLRSWDSGSYSRGLVAWRAISDRLVHDRRGGRRPQTMEQVSNPGLR